MTKADEEKPNRTNQFRPGIVFKNGRLLKFERYSLTVMNPWPKPLAWRRTTRRPFRPVRPEIDLNPKAPDDNAEPYEIRAHQAVRDFMASVPETIRAKVSKFEKRQWHVLSLLARCPGADDLINSTPALGFALASNWVFAEKPTTQPMRTARSLVRKRQVEICEWLGFPPSQSTVNILRKVCTPDISIRSLLDLREVLCNDEGSKLLLHLPSICDWTIRVVSQPHVRKHFSSKFFHELSRLGREDEYLFTLDDLTWVTQWSILREIPGKVFHSFAQLADFEGEYRTTQRRKRRGYSGGRFPEPPLEGNSNIVPLISADDLEYESLVMEHCVADYFDNVMSGDMALYRVHAPERATLALSRERGVWRLDQVSGLRNECVSQATYGVIYGWLSQLVRNSYLQLSSTE